MTSGSVLPQPAQELEVVGGGRGRLDDLIGGYRACLLCRSDAVEQLSAVTKARLESRGVAVVVLTVGAAEACGEVLRGACAVGVRADKRLCTDQAGTPEKVAAVLLRTASPDGAVLVPSRL